MTAVEWFWNEIPEILSFTVDTETSMALYEAYQKAKEMEKWQRMKFEIPELSDEEIEKAASAYSAVNSINELELKYIYNEFIYAAKWYREQLKQRQ